MIGMAEVPHFWDRQDPEALAASIRGRPTADDDPGRRRRGRVQANLILRMGRSRAVRWRSGGLDPDPAGPHRQAEGAVSSNRARDEQGG
jgi:hypothetical protein